MYCWRQKSWIVKRSIPESIAAARMLYDICANDKLTSVTVVVAAGAGIDNDFQSERGRPEHVPRRSDGQHARLLERSVLRWSQRPRLADWKHSGRVLVGHHHHDNSRLRRQSAKRPTGSHHRSGVCHLGNPDPGHSCADHRWTLQQILLTPYWAISTADSQLIAVTYSSLTLVVDVVSQCRFNVYDVQLSAQWSSCVWCVCLSVTIIRDVIIIKLVNFVGYTVNRPIWTVLDFISVASKSTQRNKNRNEANAMLQSRYCTPKRNCVTFVTA